MNKQIRIFKKLLNQYSSELDRAMELGMSLTEEVQPTEEGFMKVMNMIRREV